MRAADALLLGAFGVALLGVDDRARFRSRGCNPGRAILACDGGDRFECEWGRLLAARGDPRSLGRLLEGAPTELEDVLRALFPAIGDRPLLDDPLVVPAGLTFQIPNYPSYEIPVPVDWAADPFENPTWRFRFQSLSRLYELYNGDPGQVEAAAALLTDWVDQVLYGIPPLDETWGDHALVIRLDRAVQLTDRYLADRPVLNRRYLLVAAQLIVTHLYALAADCCYSKRHNHGTMQDLAILGWVKRFPALRDADDMFALAGRRLLEEQVRHSVTEDGIHVENSGCYHRLFVTILDEALVAYRKAGEPLPDELVRIRDSMLEPLVQHLQPDGSFAQFGDCSDERQSKRLRELLAEIDTLGAGDPAAIAPLAWVVTGGKRGTMPALDRVYEVGGYAMFRDGWRPDATTAHFKTSHLSWVHYHADETSFEVFAHGRELLVGPGSFTYAEDDPLYAYQRSPAAHNVLVVDDDATVMRDASDARVLAHGRDGDTSWVVGTHGNYRRLGVSLARTFAFARPGTFVIVDHVDADGPHEYAQHFHLSPEVDGVQRHGDRAVVATIPDGPTVSIAAGFTPSAIETPRAWHFPDFQVKQENYDVVLRHTARDVDLPVVIVVTAPGEAPRIAEDVSYIEEAGVATISWREGGSQRRLQVPAR